MEIELKRRPSNSVAVAKLIVIPGNGLGTCRPLVTTFLPKYQYINNLVLFLKTTYLMHMVDSLTLNSRPVVLSNSGLKEAYPTYTFSL